MKGITTMKNNIKLNGKLYRVDNTIDVLTLAGEAVRNNGRCRIVPDLHYFASNCVDSLSNNIGYARMCAYFRNVASRGDMADISQACVRFVNYVPAELFQAYNDAFEYAWRYAGDADNFCHILENEAYDKFIHTPFSSFCNEIYEMVKCSVQAYDDRLEEARKNITLDILNSLNH